MNAHPLHDPVGSAFAVPHPPRKINAKAFPRPYALGNTFTARKHVQHLNTFRDMHIDTRANGQPYVVCGSIIHVPLLTTSDEWEYYVNNRDWVGENQQSPTGLHFTDANGVASAESAAASYCVGAEGNSTGLDGVKQVLDAFKSALE